MVRVFIAAVVSIVAYDVASQSYTATNFRDVVVQTLRTWKNWLGGAVVLTLFIELWRWAV